MSDSTHNETPGSTALPRHPRQPSALRPRVRALEAALWDLPFASTSRRAGSRLRQMPARAWHAWRHRAPPCASPGASASDGGGRWRRRRRRRRRRREGERGREQRYHRYFVKQHISCSLSRASFLFTDKHRADRTARMGDCQFARCTLPCSRAPPPRRCKRGGSFCFGFLSLPNLTLLSCLPPLQTREDAPAQGFEISDALAYACWVSK
jgi:hypothetical protein